MRFQKYSSGGRGDDAVGTACALPAEDLSLGPLSPCTARHSCTPVTSAEGSQRRGIPELTGQLCWAAFANWTPAEVIWEGTSLEKIPSLN